MIGGEKEAYMQEMTIYGVCENHVMARGSGEGMWSSKIMTPSVNEFISCEGGGADSRSASSVLLFSSRCSAD